VVIERRTVIQELTGTHPSTRRPMWVLTEKPTQRGQRVELVSMIFGGVDRVDLAMAAAKGLSAEHPEITYRVIEVTTEYFRLFGPSIDPKLILTAW
jgi:hypothetical protein